MNKRGFIENWISFFIFYGIGIAMMGLAIRLWDSMDFEVGLIMKLIMIFILPLAGAAFFSWKMENS